MSFYVTAADSSLWMAVRKGFTVRDLNQPRDPDPVAMSSFETAHDT